MKVRWLLPLVAACGNDNGLFEDKVLEHQLTWQQVPGEIQDCHVFKLDNEAAVEIDRLKVNFPSGSHHVHIYRSSTPEDDRVFDCFKGIDWEKWSLVVGAQTEAMDWQLPDGVTVPFEPHQQLLAQVHWLNTTNETIEPTIDLQFHTTEVSDEHLGVVFGVNKRIELPPNKHTRVEHFCPVPSGAKLHAMMGHFHGHGYNYRVVERQPEEVVGNEIYFAKDEPAFEFKRWAPAHEIPSGAGLQYECSFYNAGSNTLTWGSDTKTQEHCNMTAYYSPAESVSSLCLLAPSKLSALTPMTETVRAGDDLPMVVELATAEASDYVVTLESTDATALQVPATITIPAGQKAASFVAHALRPANVDVVATSSDARITTSIGVTGLVLSEVFYNAADGQQWIEIANQASVALDLSTYGLGAGVGELMQTRLALPMTIPAHGCIVVGGPTSIAANGSPTFALSHDLQPDLQLGGDQAAGVGLFSSSVDAMNSASRPLDLVAYGGETTSLRDGRNELAPIWPGTVPGGSLRRVSDSVWMRSAQPTPGVCEVLDAH